MSTRMESAQRRLRSLCCLANCVSSGDRAGEVSRRRNGDAAQGSSLAMIPGSPVRYPVGRAHENPRLPRRSRASKRQGSRGHILAGWGRSQHYERIPIRGRSASKRQRRYSRHPATAASARRDLASRRGRSQDDKDRSMTKREAPFVGFRRPFGRDVGTRGDVGHAPTGCPGPLTSLPRGHFLLDWSTANPNKSAQVSNLGARGESEGTSSGWARGGVILSNGRGSGTERPRPCRGVPSGVCARVRRYPRRPSRGGRSGWRGSRPLVS